LSPTPDNHRSIVRRLREGVMERSEPTTGTKVALAGGFLLLGLLAVAVWLLASASPASAQADDASTAPEASTDSAAAGQEQAPPAPPDSAALPPLDLNVSVPDLPSLPVDSTPLTQTLPPVTEVLLPALQPVVEEVTELLPAPVRAPLAPLLSKFAPPPPSPPSDTAPSATVVTDAPVPHGPSQGAETSGGRVIGGAAAHSRDQAGLRAADSSSQEDGTRAPPGPAPAVPALGSALSGFSAGRDLGQSLLLLGVVAAGVMFILGRGRRLLIEALGWLPAPWCLLIERPG
jgi:hypothetical protein